MTDTDLDSMIEEPLLEGQSSLSRTLRQLIYRSTPDWFDTLDFDRDDCFLEPALFAWFTAPHPPATLQQVMAGLIEPDRRLERIPVCSDSRGRIFLPGLGTCYTSEPAAEGELITGESLPQFQANASGKTVETVLVPVTRLERHNIDLLTWIPALLQRFFAETPGWEEPACGPDDPGSATSALNQAFALLARQDPPLYRWITQVTRTILLYQAELPNSFATLSAHGAAFLNVKGSADFIFFVDDLSHQCGHIIFNAVTLDKASYLAAAPDTPLKTITGQAAESRTLYSAFHGLFTYSLILRSMDRLLNRAALGTGQCHHVLGRIAFYLCKFATDLAHLHQPALFTSRGLQFYRRFLGIYENYHELYRYPVTQIRLDNQPYVFNLERFLQANPYHEIPLQYHPVQCPGTALTVGG